MSKIGGKPLVISDGVYIRKIENNKFEIKGPKGLLIFELPDGFKLETEDKILKIRPLTNNLDKETKAQWGTLRRILENKVIGVTNGFEKVLVLKGLGYSAEVKNREIIFKLGFSHPVKIDIPEGIEIEVKQEKGEYFIYIKGFDKEKVGNFAGLIRRIKPADRYHQKGFRYIDEIIRLKPVKKAVK